MYAICVLMVGWGVITFHYSLPWLLLSVQQYEPFYIYTIISRGLGQLILPLYFLPALLATSVSEITTHTFPHLKIKV